MARYFQDTGVAKASAELYMSEIVGTLAGPAGPISAISNAFVQGKLAIEEDVKDDVNAIIE
jgi:hypothetical protein